MVESVKLSQLSRQQSVATFAQIGGHRHHQRDESTPARLGKKQVLKVSTTAITPLFQQAFNNGGPAGLAYGFVIAWFYSMSVYMVIAEMASIAPIAGGQYFWVSIFAPERSKRFLSYITGWLTSIAWIATLAVGSIYTGSMIQGVVVLNYPSYQAEPWQGTLLYWAVILIAVFINTVISGLLPMIEILVPLVYISPHGSVSDVFLTTVNEGNWLTQGLSLCVGFIDNVATFVGADAAVHMFEEIRKRRSERARINIHNNGTQWSDRICHGSGRTVLSGRCGIGSRFPFTQAFFNGTSSYAGTTVMTVLIIGLIWCAVIGFLATASRMTWSFARDRGVPFHRFTAKVDRRNSIPAVAICIVTIIPCLLALIYIGSPTVFKDVVSLSVSGLYASYSIPCVLLLWRRTTGQIVVAPPNQDDDAPLEAAQQQQHSSRASGGTSTADYDRGNSVRGSADNRKDCTSDEVAQPPLVWGPWRIPGLFGIINNAFACVYILFVVFWSFWLPETPVTPQNMNYSIPVTGAVVAFSIFYYYIWGKKQYLGPLIEDEVRMMATQKK